MDNFDGLSILQRDETAEFRDPVCGMTVNPERAAAVVEHDGRKYYFCSKSCAERFQHDPRRYLASASQEPPAPAPVEAHSPRVPESMTPTAGTAYTCPM